MINRRFAIGSMIATMAGATLASADLVVIDHGSRQSKLIVTDHGTAPTKPAGPPATVVYYWSAAANYPPPANFPCPFCRRWDAERSKVTGVQWVNGRGLGPEPKSYPSFRVGNPKAERTIKGWLGPAWFVQQMKAPRATAYPASFAPPEWGESSGTRPGLIAHLSSRVHPGFHTDWLQSLTWPQLVAVHSDSHNGRVRWEFVNKGS